MKKEAKLAKGACEASSSGRRAILQPSRPGDSKGMASRSKIQTAARLIPFVEPGKDSHAKMYDNENISCAVEPITRSVCSACATLRVSQDRSSAFRPAARQRSPEPSASP